MNIKFTLLTVIISIFFLSCQKEIGLDISTNGTTTNGTTTNNSNPLIGAWKFISIQAKTTATNEASAAGVVIKAVTVSDYTTIDNGGKMIFDAQNMTQDSVTYGVNSTAYSTMYENGIKIDTFSMPLVASYPPMRGVAAYTRIGADSIYIHAGTSTINGVTQPSAPGGAKIRFDQNKLYITQRGNETTTTTQQGQTVKMTRQVEAVITLQKL
jgi:hypothetical protein